MTAAVSNSKTLQEWRETARFWTKHSATIRTMFSPLTEALIRDAGIRAGQLVLDVAGGAGEPSLTIAERVGAEGSVTCTDAIGEMVAAAESEAQRRGLTNITFRDCLADSLPFESNSFDAVVCRLGVMFFPDPLAALREMLRVAKPGGSVSLAVWHKNELNPFTHIVTDVMLRYIESPPADPDAPNAFRFAELEKLAGILELAGAVDVHERVLHFRIAAPISPAEFWAMRSETSDTLREKLTKLSAEQVSAATQDVLEAVRECFPNNQMNFPAQMIIVTGKKPEYSAGAERRPGIMGRILAFLYGAVSYLIFFVTFLYAIGFVGNVFVPKSVDSGVAGPFTPALVINAVLLSVFAIQHSVMARPGFKKAWTRIVPQVIERSTYVLLASLSLVLLFWQWRPMLDVVWSVKNSVVSLVLSVIFFAGWGIVLLSTFLIGHFDLFGLRQVYLYQVGRAYTTAGFKTPGLYKIVRHPIMLGFIIAFWATPKMTVGHLVFAIATTVYILIALQIEEHDLTNMHGDTYREYKKQVSMLIPLPKRK